MKGPRPPRPMFQPAKAFGFETNDPKGGRELGRNVVFRRIEIEHQKEPLIYSLDPEEMAKEKRAYLYFWPGGTTERARRFRSGGVTTRNPMVTILRIAPDRTDHGGVGRQVDRSRPARRERARRQGVLRMRRGFTLLEVMVAVAILGLALTVILSSQAGIFATGARVQRESVGGRSCTLQDGGDRGEAPEVRLS